MKAPMLKWLQKPAYTPTASSGRITFVATIWHLLLVDSLPHPGCSTGGERLVMLADSNTMGS